MKKLCFFICAVVASTASADNTITSKEYVDGQVATLQTQIPAKNTNTVLTNTGTAGTIGEKAIYDTSAAYGAQSDALVTAGAFNSAVQNALESEFVCIDWLGDVHDNAHCLLYQIRTPYKTSKNLFDIQASKISFLTNVGYATKIADNEYCVHYAWLISAWTQQNKVVFNGQENTQYTLSAEIKSRFDDYVNISLLFIYSDGSVSSTSRGNYHEYTPVKVTSVPGKTVVGFGAYYTANEDICIKNLQIEQGTNATPYQPYGENTYMPQAN